MSVLAVAEPIVGHPHILFPAQKYGIVESVAVEFRSCIVPMYACTTG